MAHVTQHPAPEAPPPPARVIIVEDDDRLRAYAKGALAEAGDIEVVGDAASLAEGLPLVDLMPDLALLDLGLPDGNGITLIEAIRARVPPCRVLVFTVFEDRASVLGTLKAGADGYILKDTRADMVLAHVRATLAGETPISARAASHLLSLVRDEPVAETTEPDAPHLSPRERELLEYLARGLSRKEAARVMNLSPYTVAEYVQGIYRKLHVRSRGEAVFEAIQAKLIRIDRE
ncbi:response regulator transcription factor [Porphyrobacter sp. YT40]|uniref:response regulator n=1 Tax=Porphyrobacter sp. YT40 TaxID=2547601 RepID=UPI0011414A49|nr:response regulator transcription factor [Porphyrobacter sp. YT40]QDH35746.1 response regulator transcription factor [Porphyrobacter sp. YT40]